MDASNNGGGGGGVRVARKAIMVVITIVILGHFMMWFIMPNKFYRGSWVPNMKAKMNSTYFGSQGPQILVYTFPVLFVAVLGSMYLHLGKKSPDHGLRRKEEKSSRLAVMRRPVLVRGPLGIVSGIELSFFVMFIALLAWQLYMYLHVGFAKITPAQVVQYAGGKRWRAKWDRTVFSFGLTGNLCLTFLFYPVARGSSILPLFGLTSEGSIKYHIWLGHLVMTFFTAHGLGYLLLWAVTSDLHEVIVWDKVGISNVAGELSLLAGLGLWLTTFPRIRRKMFEVFFYMHHLYILFVFFFILHVGISYAYYMLPGFYLFMVDRYVRFLQSRQRVRLLSARALPCETLELSFAKSPSLSYTPTSIMFINVPGISKLQWHPFTITSNSNLEQDKLSVVIKVEGTWTRKLYNMVASSPLERLEVSVEGPYGPASSHFLRHDTIVMVSGGSGITPFFSIIRELLFVSTTLRRQTPRLLLISAFKNATDLSMLDLLLPVCSTPFDISNLDLKIKAYVTKGKGQLEDDLERPRTIWFKPNATDAPISATLGQNSWLWLGAIISASFVGFLVFMGLLTRYYIYPIDKNTGDIFSTSGQSVLNLLILCICIAMAGSFAVLWNKKRNAMDTKQIMNLEGITPKATPESRFYNADRELESLPHQSILQSTEVFYGERPDLKRLLFDCTGSSVGVLVCGPHGMRREVAAICSSGLAENLHFESISFSW